MMADVMWFLLNSRSPHDDVLQDETGMYKAFPQLCRQRHAAYLSFFPEQKLFQCLKEVFIP
jgi:hypothetical protein